MKKTILFINPFAALLDILEAAGYVVLPVHEADRQIKKKIWSRQPRFIIYFIGNIDCNGIDPLEKIPRKFWGRTIIISTAVDGEALLYELNQRLKS